MRVGSERQLPLLTPDGIVLGDVTVFRKVEPVSHFACGPKFTMVANRGGLTGALDIAISRSRMFGIGYIYSGFPVPRRTFTVFSTRRHVGTCECERCKFP